MCECQQEQIKDTFIKACLKGHEYIMKIMVEKGADPNIMHVPEDEDECNFPILITLCILCGRGKKRKRKIYKKSIRTLVDLGANINITSINGLTPLLCLTQTNETLDIAKFLIDKGADVNLNFRNGTTPLIRACECLYLDMVGLLLETGADVNKFCDVNNRYRTNVPINLPIFATIYASHLLSETGRPFRIFNLLLEHGADVNCKNAEGETPLLFTLKYMKKEFKYLWVQFLLERGADVNARDNINVGVEDIKCEEESVKRILSKKLGKEGNTDE